MLIAAAALDLTRCSLVLLTFRHAASAVGLVAAGIGAAVVSVTAARGYRAGQRWAAWAALLIGVASAPQASASGFHDPYTIPDVATAALGVLLTVAILATAGRPGQPVRYLEPPGPAGAWSARPISSPSPEPGRPSPAASSPGEPASRRPDMTGTGRQGRTPLHHAALADDADTVAMLLAQGADPDAADQIGFTSLHLAAQQRATSAAAVLLSAGARLDAVNSYGNTPLSTPQGRVAAGAGRRPPQQGRDGTEQGH